MADVETVNYEDFEKLHVVRRLRQIVGSWWKVQLNFTDTKGYLRGVTQGKFFNPANPLCAFITEEDRGFRDCRLVARRTTEENIDSPTKKLGRCHAGFSTLSLPLKVGKQSLGCVFADGFLFKDTEKEQKEQLRHYLKETFPDDSASLEQYIDTLPVLGSKEIEYLTELTEVVIEEVLSLRKTLYESDEKLEAMSKELTEKWDFGKMVGKSAAIIRVFKLLTRVAPSDATVLITGENGTGKEGIAKAIHFNSKRKDKPFIIQNCGALNDNLLESELFGHIKGSFTGANRDKKGLFELAHNGTLFLDEIGDTSMSMQVKLLRVLQEGTFIPVGGGDEKTVNLRVIAATNKKLEEMVKNGEFREDLYYRLNVINIQVPALRDRKEDIIVLAKNFLEDFAKKSGEKVKKLGSELIHIMENHDWPGNVRELQNEIERLCVLAGEDEIISHEFLSDRILKAKQNEKFPGVRMEGKLKEAIEELEREMIHHALVRNDWNKSRAAKNLGISRAGLIMKCDKYGLKSPPSQGNNEYQGAS